MLRILTIILLLCVPVLQSCQQEQASKPLIISTIKPVQALVYAVVGKNPAQFTLLQLLPDGASPHHYALRPSDQRHLNSASAVFYIGEGLETFLTKPLANLPPSSKAIALVNAPNIQHLYARTEEADDAHEHAAANSEDLHLWLNPANAIAITQEIARVLGEIDPSNQTTYQTNAQQTITHINALDAHIKQQLQGVRGKPYIAFHDAWQHFDQHYGLNFAGAVTLDASRLPGARHVQDIHQLITQQQVQCLFQEPQFPPALVKTLVEGTNIRVGEIDPLGVKLPLDENTYTALLQSAADSFQNCLSANPN